MVPKPAVRNDSIMSGIVKDDAPMFSWKGHDKRILVYPVDHDKYYNVTCTHPQELSDQTTSNPDTAAAVGKSSPSSLRNHYADTPQAYNQKVPFSIVRDIYSDFPPTAKRLLELADPNGFRVWKLLDMDEIPTWSNNHTILLGDACHPVSPFGFSGASMAIEDAATLSTLFGPNVESTDISERLKLYEEIRKPRVGRVRDTARQIGMGEETVPFMKDYMGWLSSHDAVEHAKRVLSERQGTKVQ